MTESETSSVLIRENIAKARQNEDDSRELRAFLGTKAKTLHHCIELPPEQEAEALYDFVVRYIEHVPEFIDALAALSKEAGIFDEISVFIRLAEGYFLKPPEVVHIHSGMAALIDEAYLAHRLVEEVNDRIMIACGAPLTPMDMTISNIVIHELLGDAFANKLDFAVLYATESLFMSTDFLQNSRFKAYIDKRKQHGWGADLVAWPCLAGDSAISLRMTHDDNPPTKH